MSLEDGGRKTVYGATRAEVQTKLRQLLDARDRGVTVTSAERTVADYLDQWLENTAKPSVRHATYLNYALNVRRLKEEIGWLRLSELGPAHVQRAYGNLLKSGLSAHSVIQAHVVLHRALREAVLWGLVLRNATDGVSRPRIERAEIRTLSQAQVKKLFESTKGDRLHALWVLLATTGLREGEALGLRWSDIDLKAGRLSVRRSLQRQKGRGMVFVEPKTNRSRRVVYLAAGTTEVLKNHRHDQAEERLQLGGRWKADDLVFTSIHGQPLQQGLVSWSLHQALEKAGLPRIRVHDLRHTAATHLLEKGVHPKVVQELLGHSTIMVTLDTYSHVAPALHAEVAERMQDLFDTSPPRSR